MCFQESALIKVKTELLYYSIIAIRAQMELEIKGTGYKPSGFILYHNTVDYFPITPQHEVCYSSQTITQQFAN